MIISLATPHYLLLSLRCLPAKADISKENIAEMLQNVFDFCSRLQPRPQRRKRCSGVGGVHVNTKDNEVLWWMESFLQYFLVSTPQKESLYCPTSLGMMQRKNLGSRQSSTAEYGAFFSAEVMEGTSTNSKYCTNEMALAKGNIWSLSPQYSAYSIQIFSTIPIHK